MECSAYVYYIHLVYSVKKKFFMQHFKNVAVKKNVLKEHQERQFQTMIKVSLPSRIK